MTPKASAITLVVATLALAAPVSAQGRGPAPPDAGAATVALRPFVLASGQRFLAAETFEAVVGGAVQPFWGGGAQLTFRDRFFVDVTVSHFKATGERAFRFDGRTFGLGIPLTVSETPVEISVGYRRRVSPRLVPYVGAGIGSYSYEETSTFADDDENVRTRHSGYLLTGGTEFRLGRWVGLTGDVQYTHVPGVFGNGGISREVDEQDLGGLAARFRVIIGGWRFH